MGHLVNPIGFRLGFLDSWVWRDFWCVKHLYYSEFLHNTYRIREELHSVLNGAKFFNLGGLYSHFCIYRKQNKFYVYVFLYDGVIEGRIDKDLADFLVEESENRKFARSSPRNAVVRGAMRSFFNVFVGNMYYFRSAGRLYPGRRLWLYSYRMEKWLRYELTVHNKRSLARLERKQRWSKGSLNPVLLEKIRRRFAGMRFLLMDRLLPSWKRIMLFKVVFGSGFLSGLRMHMLIGLQEPFYRYLSFCLSNSFLDKFSLLKTKILFLGIRNREVTAFMLSRFIAIRLAQDSPLWDLITPLRRELKYLTMLGKGKILGFKFHFCGRFSRRQRASSVWVVSGELPLSSMGTFIDYSFSEVVLTNSMCSIKVWLYRRKGARRFTYQLHS